jgi:hypothetical protein
MPQPDRRRRGRAALSIALALTAAALFLFSIASIVKTVAPVPPAVPAVPPKVFASTSPTIERLEALQELAIQKVHVADVMEYRNGWTAAWLVKGDGLISISLREARIVEVDPQRRTARIVLPQPRVLSARVDHEKTLHYDHKQGVWNSINVLTGETYPDVNARAMKEMQRLVEHAVAAPEHFDHARSNAVVALKALYKGLDWDVSVDWSDPEKPDPLPAPNRDAVKSKPPG